MVVAEQFPMFKLATLIARQMSSPVASRIKEYAKTHPWFSRVVCARTAQLYSGAALRCTLWTLRMRGAGGGWGAWGAGGARGAGGAGGAVRAPTLSDAQARELGGDLLGEAVIFALGAAIVLFEVNRQELKKQAKELDVESQWLSIKLSLEELQAELALQQAELERLHAALHALAGLPPPPPSRVLALPSATLDPSRTPSPSLPFSATAEPQPAPPAAGPSHPPQSPTPPVPTPAPPYCPCPPRVQPPTRRC